MQVEIMDPEEAARLLEVKRLENEAKERAKVAATNRAAGHADPKAGDRLYVSCKGMKRRSRAGCTFSDETRTLVTIVADDEEVGPVLEGDKPTGAYRVHAAGAELILADNALSVNAQNAQEADASDLRKQLVAMDAEIERLKADHARALREARMSAKDAGDGSPSRLIAQRKARAAQGDDGFGGKD